MRFSFIARILLSKARRFVSEQDPWYQPRVGTGNLPILERSHSYRHNPILQTTFSPAPGIFGQSRLLDKNRLPGPREGKQRGIKSGGGSDWMQAGAVDLSLPPNRVRRERGTEGVSDVYRTGLIFQISSAYWRMVRSLENFPERATFKMAFFCHISGSLYCLPASFCMAR